MRRLLVLILALLMLAAPVAVLPAQQPKPQQAQTQTKEQTVYITKTGMKYHQDGCGYLSRSRIRPPTIATDPAIRKIYLRQAVRLTRLSSSSFYSAELRLTLSNLA